MTLKKRTETQPTYILKVIIHGSKFNTKAGQTTMQINSHKIMLQSTHLEGLNINMTETLSELFQQRMGAAVEINGLVVRPSYKLNLEKGEHRFLIRRLEAKKIPLQAIRIKVKKGELFINGQSFDDVILWADTSPELLELRVKVNDGGQLMVWNAWKVDELTQAWVGNAGVSIVEGEKLITLNCSNGIGSIDFSDLIVQIERCDKN